MPSKLYGVGIGPGDSKLLTQKAIDTILQADVIAIPYTTKDKSTAYQIVEPYLTNNQEILKITTKMQKNMDTKTMYQEATDAIKDCLDNDKTVAFVTLGDPSIYSTYMYINDMILELGYEVEVIPGITSFSAAAALLNMPLCLNDEELHIIPSTYTNIEEILKYSGTKVLMKSGAQLQAVLEVLKQHLDKNDIQVVCNATMPNEKIYTNINEIEEISGYFTLIIIKEKK